MVINVIFVNMKARRLYKVDRNIHIKEQAAAINSVFTYTESAKTIKK